MAANLVNVKTENGLLLSANRQGVMLIPQEDVVGQNATWRLLATERDDTFKFMNMNTNSFLQFTDKGAVNMAANVDALDTRLRLTNGVGNATEITCGKRGLSFRLRKPNTVEGDGETWNIVLVPN